MKYSIANKNLRVVLDELGEEYKDLLIENVLNESGEIDADQISSLDLIRLDIKTKSTLQINDKTKRQNRITKLTLILGVLYSLLGLLLLLVNEMMEVMIHNTTMTVSFVLIFMGIAVSLVSLFVSFLLKTNNFKYKSNRYTIKPFEIVNKWKEIEALISQITPYSENLSLSSMLKYIQSDKIITNKEYETLIALLEIRNEVVHDTEEMNISQDRLKELFIETDRIITKLKRSIKQ